MGARHESIICPGCGCLCDDLDVTVDGDRIVEVSNVCLWGVSRFFHAKKFHPKKERHRLREPQVRHQGRRETVSYEAALAEAAQVLSRARRPLIYGLTNSGSWAQEAALKLARSLRARLEPADLAFKAPYYQSIQQHGLAWAPLEVIRDEADTVLFWGANPIHSAPRHVVRYAVFARGRFTERGIEDRQMAAVDIYPTELARFCPLFIKINPGQEVDLVPGVAAILAGEPPPDPGSGEPGGWPNFWPRPPAGSSFAAGGSVMARPWNCLTGWPAWWPCLNQRGAVFPLPPVRRLQLQRAVPPAAQ